MNTAKGPAWQVRESARRDVFESVRQMMYQLEEEIEEERFYEVLLHEVVKGLREPVKIRPAGPTFTIIPGWKREHTEKFMKTLSEMKEMIQRFQRSTKEGNALLAEILVWAASRIAEPHHRALNEQEHREPFLIYRTGRATDMVPFR